MARKGIKVDEGSDDEAINAMEKEVRKGGRLRKSRSKARVFDDEDDTGAGFENEDLERTEDLTMKLSSQLAELTQDIGEVRPNERNNLEKLSSVQRETALSALTRLVLFKALAGESIDRTKCVKEAGINDARISSAAFDEVNKRLKNMFDFELKRQPEWMNKLNNLSSAKYTKDRYYLINALQEEQDGLHSRALHAIHNQSSIEKGLLMVVLAFTYCKGEPRNDGSRWILDKFLYQLLNKVDENIPAEPPIHGTKKNRCGLNVASGRPVASGVSQTPDVDACLDKYCRRDYLIKEKATYEQIHEDANVEEGNMFYAMGPRAALEIGRKQVIYFCAEILDEEPDPTMLAELDDRHDDEDDD